MSYSSSCISASEFFDAEEHHESSHASPSQEKNVDVAGGVARSDAENELDAEAGALSDSSSEAGSLTSEEGSASSENSELATEEFNAAENGKVAPVCLVLKKKIIYLFFVLLCKVPYFSFSF